MAPRSFSAALALETYTISEHMLQVDVKKMLDRVLRADVVLIGVDPGHSLNMQIGRNGKPIGLIEGQKRKARGITAGVPDFLLFHDCAAFGIELKRDADSPLSQAQKDLLPRLMAQGVRISVCWKIVQVFAKCREWELVRPGAVMT